MLTCAACSTQNAAVPTGSNFSAFTFNLVLTDITDNAKGTFVGSSTGGLVFSDVSGLTINWSPLQLGPGTSGATSGNFGTSTFVIGSPTRIVAPNSGSPSGDTTVQGSLNTGGVPEPTTIGLVGIALLGLGAFKRNWLHRQ